MPDRHLRFLVLGSVVLMTGCGSGEPEVLPQPSPEEAKAQAEAYEKEMTDKMKQMRRPIPKRPGG